MFNTYRYLICYFYYDIAISSTKRTSSSSGFSSARSERSDSSNSLSNEPKTVPRYISYHINYLNYCVLQSFIIA